MNRDLFWFAACILLVGVFLGLCAGLPLGHFAAVDNLFGDESEPYGCFEASGDELCVTYDRELGRIVPVVAGCPE